MTRRVASWLMCAAVAFPLFFTQAASAGDLNWRFQRIDDYVSDAGGHLAMAMRTGATWPSVFYNGSGMSGLSNQVVASSLTPVGWMPSGLGTYPTPDTWLRSAAGQDGRVGAVMMLGNSVRFSQSSAMGWQSSTAGTVTSPGSESAPDVDYLSGNRPVVAYSDNNIMKVAAYDGLAWNTDTVAYPYGQPIPGTHVSMAVDSQNRIGVACVAGGQVGFAFKNQLSGTWSVTTVANVSGVQDLSLAFGPNDEPGLAIQLTNGNLMYTAFDIPSASWQTEMSWTGVTSDRVHLTFDSLGHPALAFVAQLGGPPIDSLIYSVNLGGGWIDHVLPQGLDPASGLYRDPYQGGEAALAFDATDTPLLAYHSADARLVLAYDPVAPEPASALLVIAVGVAAWRRTRRA